MTGAAPSGEAGAKADEYTSNEQHADHHDRTGGDDVAETVAHVESELESAGGGCRYPSSEENRQEQGGLGDQRCWARVRGRGALILRWLVLLAAGLRVAARDVRQGRRVGAGSEMLGRWLR